MRDPTRGGLSASLCEIASASGVGIDVVERDVPVPAEVKDACGLLGLDPWQVANEGKLVAIVPAEHAETALERVCLIRAWWSAMVDTCRVWQC
ncbi:AIR synthase-related protein [Nocardioides bruguierae]|uniref:AIR synthase-related protein n=1 Tax=Nocardioides bruguierae TaxID=2945102 RepID=UPI0025473AFC|nr:AIR synthase-related protein [Nocardioides bruguierae]